MIDGPHTLCVMPTFACTAECRHCGTFSSPRQKTELAPAVIRVLLKEAAEAGYQKVVFSGGEPTLRGKELTDWMRDGKALGLRVSMVSNGHWAGSDEDAARAVEEWREAGLDEVTLSTGDEHARFVPLNNVERAARALADAAIAVCISVETTRASVVRVESVRSAGAKVVSQAWSPLSAERIESYPDGCTANRDNVPWRGGCPEMFSITTVQADGVISPCCGLGIRFVPELRLGRVGEMTLMEAGRLARADELRHRVREEGPEYLLAQAQERDAGIEWENRYAHRCQACMRVFRDGRVRAALGGLDAD